MESNPLLRSSYGIMYPNQRSSYGSMYPGSQLPAAVGHPAVLAPQNPPYGGLAAPSARMFDTVPGYEGTSPEGSGGGFLPPPDAGLPDPPREPAPVQTEWNIPSISEDTARDALVQYASSKCCYSTDPAEQLVFSNLEAHNTYRYRLETFTESRSTEWAHEAYRGQPVDAYTQPPPAPWVIPAKAPTMFKDATQEIKIPNTAYVKPCHTCTGTGKTPCTKCTGCGSKQCWVCSGSGVRAGGESCHHCKGTGRTNCDGCKGTGLNSCDTCKGKGQLLVYIKLKIKWKNNMDDFVGDQQSGFPVSRVSAVTGKKVFVEKQHLVYPVVGFPDPAISRAAKRLVRQHHDKFAPTCRILQQRQTIELIPITKASYSFQEKEYTYFVYGAEHKVYTEDYPGKCCCCTII
ncbi:protein SSUH2 homolog isoform X2 [Acipenser ruthenus]|uniref:protein SSUH2 homolog isoform X2 n=1 Tax=Acipenser ruthenus TaxID=7906 RepID=UPI002742460F|nr:protein SSUH2 homolog isoform X2 [Acipenser ruthenus]